MEACVAAGLDPWKWESGDYAPAFKARILAWFELDRLVGTHVEDARAEKMKARSRRR